MKENSEQKLKDMEALRKLGYIQELNRSMGFFTNFAIAFSVISVLTGINVLYGYGLKYVGLACIWALPFVGIFQLTVALSLSEIAAIYPVAGGVYKWATILSNKTIGWFCGMIALVGWTACAIGVDYGLAQFIIALLDIKSENMVMLLTIIGVIIFIHSILNLYGIKLIKWFCHSSVIIHLVGILIIASLLFVFGKQGAPPDLSLNNFLYDNNWKGLLPTFLISTWVLTGFDASANVSEESLNPSRTVPAGIVLAMIASIILGSLFLFSLGYATTNVAEINSSSQPAVIYVVNQILGPVVSKYVLLIIIIAMFICGLAKQTLIIRMIYALSRDNALPKSNVLKIVSTTYEVPTYSVLLAGVLTIAAGTMIVTLPFDALPLLVSVSVFGICLSHAITIAVSFIHLVKYNLNFFRFKIVSLGVRAVSVVWLLFICVIVFFYNIYSMIVMAAILALFLIYYFVSLKDSFYYDNTITLSEEDLIRIENMRKNYREEKS